MRGRKPGGRNASVTRLRAALAAYEAGAPLPCEDLIILAQAARARLATLDTQSMVNRARWMAQRSTAKQES